MATGCDLLLEDGSRILLADGSGVFLLDGCTPVSVASPTGGFVVSVPRRRPPNVRPARPVEDDEAVALAVLLAVRRRRRKLRG